MISQSKLPLEHTLAMLLWQLSPSVNRENVNLLLFYEQQQITSFSLEPKYEVIQLSRRRVTWRCRFLNITLKQCRDICPFVVLRARISCFLR